MEECFSHFKRLVQVEGYRAGTRPCAVPAEVLGAVEAGTRHVDTRVVNLRMTETVWKTEATIWKTGESKDTQWTNDNDDLT